MDVKVMVLPQIKRFEDPDSSLELEAGRIHTIYNKHLLSSGLRAALVLGRVRVVQGEFDITIKGKKLHFKGKPGGADTYQIEENGKMITRKVGWMTEPVKELPKHQKKEEIVIPRRNIVEEETVVAKPKPVEPVKERFEKRFRYKR